MKKAISLNINTEFLESEAVRRLIAAGHGNALLTYIGLMTIIRRNGYFAKYDDALMSELERLTCRHPDDLDSDIWHLVQAGLFDEEKFGKEEILTTRRLQMGYMRRKDAEAIPDEYRIRSAKERRVVGRSARVAKTVEKPAPQQGQAVERQAEKLSYGLQWPTAQVSDSDMMPGSSGRNMEKLKL